MTDADGRCAYHWVSPAQHTSGVKQGGDDAPTATLTTTTCKSAYILQFTRMKTGYPYKYVSVTISSVPITTFALSDFKQIYNAMTERRERYLEVVH